jgi:hypothetical protein
MSRKEASDIGEWYHLLLGALDNVNTIGRRVEFGYVLTTSDRPTGELALGYRRQSRVRYEISLSQTEQELGRNNIEGLCKNALKVGELSITLPIISLEGRVTSYGKCRESSSTKC